MKSAIVPSEVTSLEDTIAANLSLSQVILLTTPVFIIAFTVAALPPEMHLSIYKLLLSFFVSVPFLILAIRVKRRLVLGWLTLALTYINRPHKYLFTGPNSKCECQSRANQEIVDEEQPLLVSSKVKCKALRPAELVAMDLYLSQWKVNYFTDREGKLNAYFEK